jgi:hypothetical protein
MGIVDIQGTFVLIKIVIALFNEVERSFYTTTVQTDLMAKQ